MHFANRAHAGQVLAGELRHYARRSDVIVLALPRGGVPVGFEVALALDAPLDVTAAGGDLTGRVAILVDDGLATSEELTAAVEALRDRGPRRLVVAVPIVEPTTHAALMKRADELICARAPEPFHSVGRWYRDFAPASDDEVQSLLRQARRAGWSRDALVSVDGDEMLDCTLAMPPDPFGLIVVAYASERHAKASRVVAEDLRRARFATLVVSLVTEEERAPNEAHLYRFDVDLLARRLRSVLDALHDLIEDRRLTLGLFGAGRAAAAALIVAAEDARVQAVVSCGRGDLAADAMRHVRASTLLLVGEHDADGIELHRRGTLPNGKLSLVPDSLEPLDEDTALPAVAALARSWIEAALGVGAPEQPAAR